jgi:hypothetical protein
VNIEIAQDMDKIANIVREPYVWDQVTEGNSNPKDFYPQSNPLSFWMISENEEGVILVLADNSVTTLIHPYVTKNHKGSGFYMIKAFLEWFLTNSKEDANKVNVKIPTFNKVGKNMALKIGFKEEGIDRQSYQRDGKFYDQYLLGITKNEIKEVLKWEI